MTPAERSPVPVDLYPEVRFPRDFTRRLESFLPRLAATVEKREGAGRLDLAHGGEEFVGFRPYRPGEDLRHLDWNLLARLDRPFVRTTRREASEHWTVLVDTSASMAVGPPGKLQLAAELAAALAGLGLRRGARVSLLAGSGAGAPAQLEVGSPAALPGVLGFLEGLRAEGRGALRGLLAAGGARRGIGRVFCLSDLHGLEPADLLASGGRGRALCAVRVLAPDESSPRVGGWVEWHDPESGEHQALRVDAAARSAYERLLAARLERWDQACAKHRAVHGTYDSARRFEDVLTDLFAA